MSHSDVRRATAATPPGGTILDPFAGSGTVYAFDLDHLAEPVNLDTLRKLFIDPDALRPGQTAESVTRQAAERFGLLADGMRVRGIPAQPAAHFLMKLMFCMFAEDIGLLGTPDKLFKKVLVNSRDNPPRLAEHLRLLFQAMATGGYFGADTILHFNGGLFADADVIELRPDEIKELILVNDHDWASVEPSIFGTLFERTLDSAKRSQIGAHYTSRADILTLLEPVVMVPLRREWADVKAKCDALWDKLTGQSAGGRGRRTTLKESKPRKDHDRLLQDFVERWPTCRYSTRLAGRATFFTWPSTFCRLGKGSHHLCRGPRHKPVAPGSADAIARYRNHPGCTTTRPSRDMDRLPSTTGVDSKGRLRLPPKQPTSRSRGNSEVSVKEMLGRSPDRADAVVLAKFAFDRGQEYRELSTISGPLVY